MRTSSKTISHRHAGCRFGGLADIAPFNPCSCRLGLYEAADPDFRTVNHAAVTVTPCVASTPPVQDRRHPPGSVCAKHSSARSERISSSIGKSTEPDMHGSGGGPADLHRSGRTGRTQRGLLRFFLQHSLPQMRS